MILYVFFIVCAFFAIKFLIRILTYIITGKDPKYNQ